MKSHIKVNVERAFEVIEQTLDIHKFEVTRRNNKKYRHKRDMCIYLMALTTKLSYKELAEIFYVKPAAIGMSIKRTIERMLMDKRLVQQIDTMMKLIVNQ